MLHSTDRRKFLAQSAAASFAALFPGAGIGATAPVTRKTYEEGALRFIEGALPAEKINVLQVNDYLYGTQVPTKALYEDVCDLLRIHNKTIPSLKSFQGKCSTASLSQKDIKERLKFLHEKINELDPEEEADEIQEFEEKVESYNKMLALSCCASLAELSNNQKGTFSRNSDSWRAELKSSHDEFSGKY